MHFLQYLITCSIHRIMRWIRHENNRYISDFRENVLNNAMVYEEFRMIEQCRAAMQSDNSLLESVDQGAGSRIRMKKRTVGGMARLASVNPGFGRLLFCCARYYRPETIIELGTALGISTMYLAMGNPRARVISIEGNAQLAAIAQKNFTRYGLKNVTLINDDFDRSIDRIIPEVSKNTLVFIDGNHTLDATVKYYEIFEGLPDAPHMLIFDDINWSKGMMRAWKKISGSLHANLVVDLFHMGIVFRGTGTNRQKYWL
jgi:predicted O-methyltransferase YrrM